MLYVRTGLMTAQVEHRIRGYPSEGREPSDASGAAHGQEVVGKREGDQVFGKLLCVCCTYPTQAHSEEGTGTAAGARRHRCRRQRMGRDPKNESNSRNTCIRHYRSQRQSSIGTHALQFAQKGSSTGEGMRAQSDAVSVRGYAFEHVCAACKAGCAKGESKHGRLSGSVLSRGRGQVLLLSLQFWRPMGTRSRAGGRKG
eukprot:1158040-Pelagomonas_calceolata.AAC.11